MEYAQLPDGPYEVNINLDVFRPPMVNRIGGHVHSHEGEPTTLIAFIC
jgi:hypothetical protein